MKNKVSTKKTVQLVIGVNGSAAQIVSAIHEHLLEGYRVVSITAGSGWVVLLEREVE